MSSTPRLIGTLIVVVLKAKNLPNKRHIGKQDPYCTLKLNNEVRRTKAVKRGGQHPEWDEEVRFELYEDVEDELARTADGSSPPPPPPKDERSASSRSKEKNFRAGKTMRILCYADDPREPELIGETAVDLTEALTKGETDEWFTLMSKDKYCGEVYLELTFWLNEKEPEKKPTARPSVVHPQYGGPGSFKPSTDDEVPSALRTGRGGSAGNSPRHHPHGLHGRPASLVETSAVPDSLRPSTSLAKLDLYVPPYGTTSTTGSQQGNLGNISEFGVNGSNRRRESFPPSQGQPSSFGFQGPPQNPYSPSSIADSMGNMALNDQYGGSSAFFPQPSQFNGSLYQPAPPHSSGFVPQPSMTPMPSGFQPTQQPYSGFAAPRPTATPMPFIPSPPSAMGFHQQYPPQVQAPIPPPFQHHQSWPITSQPGVSHFAPAPTPIPGQYGPAPPPGSVFQHGRPLPEQPQPSGFVPIGPPMSFPSHFPYNPSATPMPPPPPNFVQPGAPPIPQQPPHGQPQPPQPPQPYRANSLPPALPVNQGSILPPPPPPLLQQAQPFQQPGPPPPIPQQSLTFQAAAPSVLPLAPHQSENRYDSTQSSLTQSPSYSQGMASLPLVHPSPANPLPPLPNPPLHQQFQSPPPLVSGVQLPGPPPPLPNKTGTHPLPVPPPVPQWHQFNQQQNQYPPNVHSSYPPQPSVNGNWS